MYKVLKKNGEVQDFDPKKIEDAVIKSGGTEDEGIKIANEIESWLDEVAQDGVVDGILIRSKVIELLQEINPDAAAAFEAYRK